MTQLTDYAEKSLYELVKYVFSHSLETIEGISYEDLAFRIGRRNKHGKGHGRGMGKVLGEMGRILRRLDGKWEEPMPHIPHINSLVVSKSGPSKGLPDEGIKEFWPEYPKLSRREKISKGNSD